MTSRSSPMSNRNMRFPSTSDPDRDRRFFECGEFQKDADTKAENRTRTENQITISHTEKPIAPAEAQIGTRITEKNRSVPVRSEIENRLLEEICQSRYSAEPLPGLFARHQGRRRRAYSYGDRKVRKGNDIENTDVGFTSNIYFDSPTAICGPSKSSGQDQECSDQTIAGSDIVGSAVQKRRHHSMAQTRHFLNDKASDAIVEPGENCFFPPTGALPGVDTFYDHMPLDENSSSEKTFHELPVELSSSSREDQLNGSHKDSSELEEDPFPEASREDSDPLLASVHELISVEEMTSGGQRTLDTETPAISELSYSNTATTSPLITKINHSFRRGSIGASWEEQDRAAVERQISSTYDHRALEDHFTYCHGHQEAVEESLFRTRQNRTKTLSASSSSMPPAPPPRVDSHLYVNDNTNSVIIHQPKLPLIDTLNNTVMLNATPREAGKNHHQRPRRRKSKDHTRYPNHTLWEHINQGTFNRGKTGVSSDTAEEDVTRGRSTKRGIGYGRLSKRVSDSKAGTPTCSDDRKNVKIRKSSKISSTVSDGGYTGDSSGGEETQDEIMEKIKCYNRSMGTFRMEALPRHDDGGKTPLEFQGVLRFYHMSGSHAVSKALKLKSTTSVADLLPLLVEKFGLTRHLEESGEGIEAIKVFQRRIDGEVPLEEEARPLELALTSRSRSRFVVRVVNRVCAWAEDVNTHAQFNHHHCYQLQEPWKSSYVSVPVMRTTADVDQHGGFISVLDSSVGENHHHDATSRKQHGRRTRQRKRNVNATTADGSVSDCDAYHTHTDRKHCGRKKSWRPGLGSGYSTDTDITTTCRDCNGNVPDGRITYRGRSRKPDKHRNYESDGGGVDVIARESYSSRRNRRRRERKEQKQLKNNRESSLERLANQVSLRKGSLRLTRSMTNLVHKTFSLRQKETPLRCPATSTQQQPELSTEASAPGVLKVFGGSICPGAEYKSVLATPASTGRELVKEALERYQISRRQARHYVLCDVIGSFKFANGTNAQSFGERRHSDSHKSKKPQPAEMVWVEECVRIVGDHERPLTIQSFWKPSGDCSRRFELRRRTDLATNVDTVTSGINANARRMLVSKARLRTPGLGHQGEDAWPVMSTVSANCSGDDNKNVIDNSSSVVVTDMDHNNSSFKDSQDIKDDIDGADLGYFSTATPKNASSSRSSRRQQQQQQSPRAPVTHPYLLTLRGYDEQRDRLVHVLREQVTMVGGGGDDAPRQRHPSATDEDICLLAPDILPEHCWLSRAIVSCSPTGVVGTDGQLNSNVNIASIHGDGRGAGGGNGNDGSRSGGSAGRNLPGISTDRERLSNSMALDPIPGATVRVNGQRTDCTVTLKHGDVIEIGAHYAFLYKAAPSHGESETESTCTSDSTNSNNKGQVVLTQVRHSMENAPTQSVSSPSGLNKSNVHDSANSQQPAVSVGQHVGASDTTSTNMLKWARSRSDPVFEMEPGRMRLSYVREKEDELLDRIMTLSDRYPNAPNLSKAYLVCMCVEHSMARFGLGACRDFISKTYTSIQMTVWDATKLLADKQQSTTSDRATHVSELILELKSLILWLTNAVELHYFFRKQVREALRKAACNPLTTEGEEGPAEEEMVVILEDVVKYTFQQTVYYLTKALYPHLPAILDRNPFSAAENESSIASGTETPTVEGLVVVLETILTSMKEFGLHPEILSQLFCYLFYFTSTNLFNMLMTRGKKYYKWSKGVHIRGNLDTLEAWATSSGLAQEAINYLTRINSLTNLLATPRLQLLTANWAGLRRDFPQLNNEQLLKVLTEYELGPGQEQPEAWGPPDGAIDPVTWSSHLTEGFSDHPPLRLPKGGFLVDLSNASPEEELCDLITRMTAEFGVSDDDGDSGLNVSQTLPVFTDIPHAPIYIAEGKRESSEPPIRTDSYLEGQPHQSTTKSSTYETIPVTASAACHITAKPNIADNIIADDTIAPCTTSPCPIPPKRRSRQKSRTPAPPRPPPPTYIAAGAPAETACTTSSGGNSPISPEPDLGDSGISMSVSMSERGQSGSGVDCGGLRRASLPVDVRTSRLGVTMNRRWNVTQSESLPDSFDLPNSSAFGHGSLKSRCDASQATLFPTSPVSSADPHQYNQQRQHQQHEQHVKHHHRLASASPKGRQHRSNSKSPTRPGVRPPAPPNTGRNQDFSPTTMMTSSRTSTGTCPLAVSSPVSCSSDCSSERSSEHGKSMSPCTVNSGGDVLSGIPPQPKNPAPTLDRASLRRITRPHSLHGPSTRSPQRSSDISDDVFVDNHDCNTTTGVGGEGSSIRNSSVVEVSHLEPTTADGVTSNGLRVLPLGGEAEQTAISAAGGSSSSNRWRRTSGRMSCGESSSVDGDQLTLEEEQEDVYIVDLVKGEKGLGLGLIDGLFTPLRRPGIYVRTLVPGEAAERDGRLQIGDRILAVNGQSVVGADYRSAMNAIRDGGQFLQFLVAQGSRLITMQITASSC